MIYMTRKQQGTASQGYHRTV